jgi:hypothetical protein
MPRRDVSCRQPTIAPPSTATIWLPAWPAIGANASRHSDGRGGEKLPGRRSAHQNHVDDEPGTKQAAISTSIRVRSDLNCATMPGNGLVANYSRVWSARRQPPVRRLLKSSICATWCRVGRYRVAISRAPDHPVRREQDGYSPRPPIVVVGCAIFAYSATLVQIEGRLCSFYVTYHDWPSRGAQ